MEEEIKIEIRFSKDEDFLLFWENQQMFEDLGISMKPLNARARKIMDDHTDPIYGEPENATIKIDDL